MKLLYLLILLILIISCGQHKGNSDALLFLSKFYPGEAVMAACQEWDTDENGYVSCTAKVGKTLIALECPVEPRGCDCHHNTDCRIAVGSRRTTD